MRTLLFILFPSVIVAMVALVIGAYERGQRKGFEQGIEIGERYGRLSERVNMSAPEPEER